jgi:quercetin dioxygenase-like cupin family protein
MRTDVGQLEHRLSDVVACRREVNVRGADRLLRQDKREQSSQEHQARLSDFLSDRRLLRHTARMIRILVALAAVGLLSSVTYAQAVGPKEKAQPVAGDPGMSYREVVNNDQYRILQDWAEPGAVRRMHNHPGTTYHIFTLMTGQLSLTVEGKAAIDVKAGDVLEFEPGVMHGFKNTGTVTATIVEVFGKPIKK